MLFTFVIFSLVAALGGAVPSGFPGCPGTPSPDPTPCNLNQALANGTSPECIYGALCVAIPGSNSSSDMGICVGHSCGSVIPGDGVDCKPCPTNQVCAFNFSGMPSYPGYCALPLMTCGHGKTCSNGWHCTQNPKQPCESGDDDCPGLCTPPYPASTSLFG